MSDKKVKTQKLAVISMLSALMIIVSFVPLRTLGLEITFSMVPVAIGAMLYGPSAGAVLGLVFGVVSFLQCLGWSAFGTALLGINPLLTFLVCVPTRLLAGLIAGLVSKALKNVGKTNSLSLISASVTAPVLNTVFFMGLLTICFYNTDYIQGFADMLGAVNPFNFIILFVGINGLVEIIAGIIVAFPCGLALFKALRLR